MVTEDPIIVAAEVTQDPNDVNQLHPTLRKARANLNAAGVKERIANATADAGYWSQANVEKAPEDGPELSVATTKSWKLRQATEQAPLPEESEAQKLREQMAQKLRTETGRAIDAQRSQTVEPVFGQIKDVRGCDRFMRRGLAACDSAWKLIALTHNLLKLWRWVTGRLQIPMRPRRALAVTG